MKTVFGNNLRALREDRKLTQRELAKKVRTTHTTIANYENSGKYPQRDEIKNSLLNVLNCNEVDLYGYSDGYYAQKYFASTSKSEPKDKDNKQFEEYLVDLNNYKFYKLKKIKRAIDESILKNYPNGKFIKINDDSMNRFLPKDSYAYIFKDNYDNYNNKVCALTLDGFKILFRRISQLQFDELITLVPQSTNNKYKSITINKNNYPDYKIYGRVVWFSNDAGDL